MVLVVLRRVFSRFDPIRRFETHYAEEGNLPLSPEESELLTKPNRCTGCGLCDLDGSRRLVVFALGGVRSLPDADAATLLVKDYTDQDLRRAESICPENVPISAFAELVRAHATRRRALVSKVRDESH